MKTIKLKFMLAMVLIASSQLAWSGGDPDAGQEKSTACQACHGATGEAVDKLYPNLGGQHEDYLVKALTDYRDGGRKNPIMMGFAMNLTDEDIEDLAAFYASQKGLRTLDK